MLIQQARGFSALFQLSDLMTLTLTSFLYQRLTQLSIFREEAETQGRASGADWRRMLTVRHAYPEMPRMVYSCLQPANGQLQTLTHTCFRWLSPFILGHIKDWGIGEASCMAHAFSASEVNHLPGRIDEPITTRLSSCFAPTRSLARENIHSCYSRSQNLHPKSPFSWPVANLKNLRGLSINPLHSFLLPCSFGHISDTNNWHGIVCAFSADSQVTFWDPGGI